MGTNYPRGTRSTRSTRGLRKEPSLHLPRRGLPDMVFKTNGFDRVREPVHINEGEGDFAVSDGLHVLLPQSATGLFDPLRERGYEPIGMDLSELLKGGGSVKCCTQELRV